MLEKKKNIRMEYTEYVTPKIEYHAKRRGRRGQGVGVGMGINISVARGTCFTVEIWYVLFLLINVKANLSIYFRIASFEKKNSWNFYDAQITFLFWVKIFMNL